MTSSQLWLTMEPGALLHGFRLGSVVEVSALERSASKPGGWRGRERSLGPGGVTRRQSLVFLLLSTFASFTLSAGCSKRRGPIRRRMAAST